MNPDFSFNREGINPSLERLLPKTASMCMAREASHFCCLDVGHEGDHKQIGFITGMLIHQWANTGRVSGEMENGQNHIQSVLQKGGVEGC